METEVLDKALRILNDSLDGRTVDPNAVDTAIRMLQFCWTTVFAERANERRITEALRNKWDDSIEEKEKNNDK